MHMCQFANFCSPMKDSLVTLLEHRPGNYYFQSGHDASFSYLHILLTAEVKRYDIAIAPFHVSQNLN